MPIRIQRKRIKGWKIPANTIYVGRPSQWENPFQINKRMNREMAINAFKVHLASYFGWVKREFQKAWHPFPVVSNEFEEWIAPLKGKNLACWCKLSDSCHADFLLEIANSLSPQNSTGDKK